MINFFESKLQKLAADSRAKYKRVLSAFEVFLIGHGLSMKDLSPRIIDDWAYDLLRKDKPKSAIVRSLNILSSVLKGENDEAARRARELVRRFDGFDASSLPSAPLIKDQAVNACISSLRTYLRGTGDISVAEDLLIVSLLGGCIPVSDLVQFRKASVSEFSGKSKEILMRNQSAQRDYVFDLRQSYRTPRQILQDLSAGISSKFPDIAGAAPLYPDQFIRSLWTALAIRSGALASEALGCVDLAPYARPDFITPEPQTPEAKERWTKAVATLIARNTSHWYAMHMRRGVTFDDLQKEIAANLRPAPTLFYPCREISRNIRNRKVLDDQPYITGTVFFRTDPSSVMPMFEKIGDLAWCYRISATPGAPYAIIPSHEMQRFQSAIGQFTPDTELHPLGTLSLRPDDRVILLMADFYNQPATVDKILTDSSGRLIYRVAFTNSSGIEWTVDAAPPQLTQVES